MLFDELMKKGLSKREAEVAEKVCQGLSNNEAAAELFVTEKTIKFHLTNVYKKMKVKSRTQLIVWSAPFLSFETKNTVQKKSVGSVSQNIPDGFHDDFLVPGITKVSEV